MDLSAQLMELAPKIMRLVRLEIAAASNSSLSIPHYRLLKLVHTGIRQIGKLAELQGVSQPTMSNLVDGLVKKNLLKRVAHPTDRRQVEVHLTPKGERLYAAIRDNADRALRARLKELKPAEREKIGGAVERLLSIFNPSRPEEEKA